MMVGRCVRSCANERLGPPRPVARSIGVGGTMSMLRWAMGYDPIVEGVERACGVATPTFVDDLAALPVGPRQTEATELFLICAAHAAGLLLDGHECEWLTCAWLHPAAPATLASLPVRILATPSGW